MWRCQREHINSASANFCPTCGAPRASGRGVSTPEKKNADELKSSEHSPPVKTKVSKDGKEEKTFIGGFVITAVDSTSVSPRSRNGGRGHGSRKRAAVAHAGATTSQAKGNLQGLTVAGDPSSRKAHGALAQAVKPGTNVEPKSKPKYRSKARSNPTSRKQSLMRKPNSNLKM